MMVMINTGKYFKLYKRKPVVPSVPQDTLELPMKGLSLTTQTMCSAGQMNVCAPVLAKGG
jgi:hypothetical protein